MNDAPVGGPSTLKVHATSGALQEEGSLTVSVQSATPRTGSLDPTFGVDGGVTLDFRPSGKSATSMLEPDGALTVAVVPVSGTLDLKALAHALGVKRVVMADPAAAERSSGYVVGGISPVGQKRALPTVLDQSAVEQSTVLVSGGRRGFDLELAPADLVAVTRAVTAPIAR